MSLKNKSKAQISAPFEVLVAIIIMTFVIITGSYVLNNLSENTCLGNKKQDISNLSSALRDVVLGSDLSYRTVNFNTRACYNSNKEVIRLNNISNNKALCENICGSGTSCVVMEYVYVEDVNLNISSQPILPICTYLPTNIFFSESLDECGINTGSSEQLINPKNGIPNGRYKIYKINSGQNINICMVKI